MTLDLNEFKIAGTVYDDLPKSITSVNTGEPFEAVKTDDGGEVLVYDAPAGDVTGLRPVTFQAWTWNWDQSAWMEDCLHDHLQALHRAQRAFWIEFDGEMSRVLCTLQASGTDYTHYLTPTYPIFPINHVLGTALVGWHVFVDGVIQSSSAYTVDYELGIVSFVTPLTEDNVVTMRYKWRCLVRIVDLDLSPMMFANVYYTGTASFEQLPCNLSIADDNVVYYCGKCDGFNLGDDEDGDTSDDGGEDEIVCTAEITSADPALSTARTGSVGAWTGLSNLEFDDNTYSTSPLLDDAELTETLSVQSFVFEESFEPTDIPISATLKVHRRRSAGDVTIFADSVALLNGVSLIEDQGSDSDRVTVAEQEVEYVFDLTGVAIADVIAGDLNAELGFTGLGYDGGDTSVGASPGTITDTDTGVESQVDISQLYTVTATHVGLPHPDSVKVSITASAEASVNPTIPLSTPVGALSTANNGLGVVDTNNGDDFVSSLASSTIEIEIPLDSVTGSGQYQFTASASAFGGVMATACEAETSCSASLILPDPSLVDVDEVTLSICVERQGGGGLSDNSVCVDVEPTTAAFLARGGRGWSNSALESITVDGVYTASSGLGGSDGLGYVTNPISYEAFDADIPTSAILDRVRFYVVRGLSHVGPEFAGITETWVRVSVNEVVIGNFATGQILGDMEEVFYEIPTDTFSTADINAGLVDIAVNYAISSVGEVTQVLVDGAWLEVCYTDTPGSQTINPTGFLVTQTFGSPTITSGEVTIYPSSIRNEVTFGEPTVS